MGRHAGIKPAVMAHQPAVREHAVAAQVGGVPLAVQHQIRRAASTCTYPAAAGARQHRRKTAPVQKHQTLLARVQALPERGPHRLRDAVFVRGGVEVNQPHRRQHRIAHRARAQQQLGVAPGFGARVGFKRGRGRSQHHRQLFAVGAKHGEIARRITHALLLLERRVVFFIDHDQPQTRQRRQYRQTCAEHNIGLPGMRQQPAMQALAIV